MFELVFGEGFYFGVGDLLELDVCVDALVDFFFYFFGGCEYFVSCVLCCWVGGFFCHGVSFVVGGWFCFVLLFCFVALFFCLVIGGLFPICCFF